MYQSFKGLQAVIGCQGYYLQQHQQLSKTQQSQLGLGPMGWEMGRKTNQQPLAPNTIQFLPGLCQKLAHLGNYSCTLIRLSAWGNKGCNCCMVIITYMVIIIKLSESWDCYNTSCDRMGLVDTHNISCVGGEQLVQFNPNTPTFCHEWQWQVFCCIVSSASFLEAIAGIQHVLVAKMGWDQFPPGGNPEWHLLWSAGRVGRLPGGSLFPSSGQHPSGRGHPAH